MVDTSVDTDLSDQDDSNVDVTGLSGLSQHDRTFAQLDFDPVNE